MQIGKSTHLQTRVQTLSIFLSLFCSPAAHFMPYTPLHQPYSCRLRKKHSMFLSFPWLLVPKPSEKGSIPNINVCCSLITAPRVGDEAEKRTEAPPRFASFPLSYLLTYCHSSSFSATSLTPSVRARVTPAESSCPSWRQKMSMCFSVL